MIRIKRSSSGTYTTRELIIRTIRTRRMAHKTSYKTVTGILTPPCITINLRTFPLSHLDKTPFAIRYTHRMLLKTDPIPHTLYATTSPRHRTFYRSKILPGTIQGSLRPAPITPYTYGPINYCHQRPRRRSWLTTSYIVLAKGPRLPTTSSNSSYSNGNIVSRTPTWIQRITLLSSFLPRTY